MPLFTDAYIADTTHLTMEQSGCYMQLLMVAWRTKTCDLPNDNKILARMCRMHINRWLKIRPVLEPFFTIEDGRIFQKRLKKERGFVQQKCEKNRANANAKWRKTNETTNANAHANAYAPTPTPTPIEERKKEHPKKDVRKKESFGADAPSSAIADPRIVLISSSANDAVRIWNEMAERTGLPKCQKLTASRKSKLNARIRDAGGMAGWCAAVERVEETPGLLGDNDRGWKATIDFLLQENSFTKLMEGGYDHWRAKRRRSKTDEVKELLKTWGM